ncbi:MAG: hypothetical protein WC784_00060 [Candidatus Shapirobacteria bacterium]|jgi:hypothetical protein
MKDKLLSIDNSLLELARFIVMLFLIALVFGIGFILMVFSAFSAAPIIWIFMGGFTNTWFLFPFSILSIYLFRVWIKISPKIIEIINPKK